MPNKNKVETDQKRLDGQTNNHETVYWIKPGERLREGRVCPHCHKAELVYNGLLQLTCPECGLTEAGACT